MTVEPDDIGTRRERRLRNRRLTIFLSTAICGAAVGLTFALVERGGGPAWFSGTIPRPMAIVFAIIFGGAMIFSGVLFARNTDELDMRDNIRAAAAGALVVLLGYPLWFILWKGGVVAEPSHVVIFLTLYATMTVVYLCNKLR